MSRARRGGMLMTWAATTATTALASFIHCRPSLCYSWFSANGGLRPVIVGRHGYLIDKDHRYCSNQTKDVHTLFATIHTEDGGPGEQVQAAFSKLAKKGKSWKRLRHLVDLACLGAAGNVRSIADVGCDHGLLSLGLALSNRFERVVGVDRSEQALKNGAIALYEKVLQDAMDCDRWSGLSAEQVIKLSPVDFVVGDGLNALQAGQADVLCIAGMGVETMIYILNPTELDRVGCQRLVLQPTNSRPGNLIRLYDSLADSGWSATKERIEYLSSRWYITALFIKNTTVSCGRDEDGIVPGTLLLAADHDSCMSTGDTYRSYISHHKQWIEKDSMSAVSISDNDLRWLEAVDDDK